MTDPSDWTNSPEELSGALPERPAPTTPDLVIPPEMIAAGEEHELNIIGRLRERPAVTEGERTSEGALGRFYDTTEGALRTFQNKIKKDLSPTLAAAALNELHKACAEAAHEYQQTIALLQKKDA